MVTHEIIFFWTYEFCEIVNLHQLLNSGNMINLEFFPFGEFLIHFIVEMKYRKFWRKRMSKLTEFLMKLLYLKEIHFT